MTSQRTLNVEFREFHPDDYERLVQINNSNYPGYEVSVSEQIARANAISVNITAASLRSRSPNYKTPVIPSNAIDKTVLRILEERMNPVG